MSTDKTYISIGRGDNAPDTIMAFSDVTFAKQTAVYLAENLQDGMSVWVDGQRLRGGQHVSIETYKALFAPLPIAIATPITGATE